MQDLHPHDRGPKGTHHGAIIANGNLYCPKTPRPLPELGPPARTASKQQAADWERETTELARYKLGRLTADDPDGYHRVQCPAAMGKIRCPLRPASMTQDRDRPEILQHPQHPQHPQACCTQQTITVSPDVLAKTAQKRLPIRRAPPLLRPPHRRRTRLRHRQRPRHQRHHPRLVPPHGPDPAHTVHSDAAHRPQPAGLSPHGTPGKNKPSAAQPPGYRRKPANGAARPSPASPPGHPDHATTTTTTSPAPVTTSQDSRHNHAKARPNTGHTRETTPATAPEHPAPDHRPPTGRNVRPKREHGPH